MSALDLIRMLRHALEVLRDAPDADAVANVARALATDLDGSLRGPVMLAEATPPTAEPDEAEQSDLERIREAEMAVCA
jgi:hypothetical protein